MLISRNIYRYMHLYSLVCMEYFFALLSSPTNILCVWLFRAEDNCVSSLQLTFCGSIALQGQGWTALEKGTCGDFPGGPVVRTLLSIWGMQDQSLTLELRSRMLAGEGGATNFFFFFKEFAFEVWESHHWIGSHWSSSIHQALLTLNNRFMSPTK